MEFTEGEIVGKVSEFKTEAEFLKAVDEEFGRDLEESRKIVKRVYVRWSPKAPWPLNCDFPDGCYHVCKPTRGAFECFMIE